MGCVLSSPVELIRVQRHGSGAFRCAVAEMQGWRNSHEDAHEIHCGDAWGAFWVLDGHGGDGAALFGAPQLAQEFAGEMAQGSLPSNERIEEGVAEVDRKLHEHFKEDPNKESGATVIGVLAVQAGDGSYTIKVVNCGDSRSIVVRGPAEEEGSAKPVRLRLPPHLEALRKVPAAVEKGEAAHCCAWPLVQETVDHKPNHPTEKARIEAANGYVTPDEPPRLDGNLAVSRGLGDFEYKRDKDVSRAEQKVSCVPDVYEVAGLQPGSLCVLCCDGVWDVLTGQDVARMVRGRLKDDPDVDLGEIATEIVRLCLERSSRDNITAMVVQLTGGPEWAQQQPPDEMKGFEKLEEQAPDKPDEEVRKQYMSFLRRAHFPPEPCTCDVCSKWYISMMQCPCKKVYYCNKQCQKKGWKKHKPICAAASSPGAGAGANAGNLPAVGGQAT